MPRPIGSTAELPLDRFMRNVRIEPNGCWIWIGAKDRRGYGVFCAEGRSHRAHKWLYERCFGYVEHGLELGHLVFTDGRHDPACVCPVHVRPITHRENLLEAPTGIAAINAAKGCCPHGHPYSPDNTYVDPNGNRECIKCRKQSDREFRSAYRTGNLNYLDRQREYRREKAEKYNASRKAKYHAEHSPRERKTECVAGHSLEDPTNVYFRLGKRNCRQCRKLAQRRYVEKSRQTAATLF